MDKTEIFKDPYLDRILVNKIDPKRLYGLDARLSNCVISLSAQMAKKPNKQIPANDGEWAEADEIVEAIIWLGPEVAEALAYSILDIVAQSKLEQLERMARNDHEPKEHS